VTTSRGLPVVDGRQPGGSLGDVQRFLHILWSPGDVRELRIPRHNRYGHTASGYFDSPDELAAAAAGWDGRANLYVSLNPVSPALLARANSRIAARAEATTADDDVTRRRSLLLDIDPVRPSGISSTDSELEAAHVVLDSVTAFLSDEGWPDPMTALSGNGYYAIYAINLPNDQASLELAKRVLSGLAARFDTDRVHVDTAVANAARLVGLIGTLKVKGDSTPDRPHRRSRLESVPEALIPVSGELLAALASTVPKDSIRQHSAGAKSEGSPVRLAALLQQHGIEYREQAPDANGFTWYHVRQCPFHAEGPLRGSASTRKATAWAGRSGRPRWALMATGWASLRCSHPMELPHRGSGPFPELMLGTVSSLHSATATTFATTTAASAGSSGAAIGGDQTQTRRFGAWQRGQPGKGTRRPLTSLKTSMNASGSPPSPSGARTGNGSTRCWRRRRQRRR